MPRDPTWSHFAANLKKATPSAKKRGGSQQETAQPQTTIHAAAQRQNLNDL
jgi:hypothetical protein